MAIVTKEYEDKQHIILFNEASCKGNCIICLQTNLNIQEGSLNSNASNNASLDNTLYQCEQNNQLVVPMDVHNHCCSQLYPDTKIKINTDWL